MANNLHFHSSVLSQLEQLLPDERVSRLHVLALFVVGLQASGSVHFGHIVRRWSMVAGQLPSLVQRLHRFVCNPRVVVSTLYAPVARALLSGRQGSTLQLVMDATKVGLKGEQGCRLLTLSLCYHKRTLPLAFSVHAGPLGQVNVQEQIVLLERVLAVLPAQCQVVLMADAGFEARELVRWLQESTGRIAVGRRGLRAARCPAHPARSDELSGTGCALRGPSDCRLLFDPPLGERRG
jgi:hypothetical protein